MKIITAVIFSLVMALSASLGFAAEESGSGMDWQISVQPQQTAAEKEAARWTEVMENSTGRYYLAKDSVFMTKGAFGDKDRNILQAEVKTVFMNEEIKKHLDSKVFAAKLSPGDSVEYCTQVLLFNLRAKQYRELSSVVYSKNGVVLQVSNKKSAWKIVPEHSFAEIMLEILTHIPASQLRLEGEE